MIDEPTILADAPLISVIIPVFNRAHAVSRSVGSICAQTYRNLDIIVVDDCSNDDIEAAVSALGDDRVRLIRRLRNGGAAAARNTGLAAARGDYIAFQDSDDISLIDRIERQIALLTSLSEDHVGMYSAALSHLDASRAAWGRVTTRIMPPPDQMPLAGDLADATLRGNFIELPSMLLRRKFALAAGPFDERLRNNEDWDFTLRLTRLGPLGFLPEPLYISSYAPRSADDNDHISHNARYSALSYLRITGKLRRGGWSGTSLARHYAAAGRYLMQIGRPGSARRYFRAAMVLRPGQPKIWIHFMLSHLPTLYARARRFGGPMPNG